MNPKLIKPTIIIIALLLVGQIFISGWRATDGDKLASVQAEITQIEMENMRLREQIYDYTSLENIALYAQNSHMIPAKITNLTSITVALNR